MNEIEISVILSSHNLVNNKPSKCWKRQLVPLYSYSHRFGVIKLEDRKLLDSTEPNLGDVTTVLRKWI